MVIFAAEIEDNSQRWSGVHIPWGQFVGFHFVQIVKGVVHPKMELVII